MRRYLPIFLLFLLLPSLVAACNAVSPGTAPTPTPIVFQPVLGRGMSFLARQFDEQAGLLRESPAVPDHHWLVPDNQLALWVMELAIAADLEAEIAAGLDAHPGYTHGLIEALHGTAVAWPPSAPRVQEIAPSVWVEQYSGGDPAVDWQDDSSLLLYGAINAIDAGQREEAEHLYNAVLRQFDGIGFIGSASADQYATGTLALALLTAERLRQPVEQAIRDQLLALQQADGGFSPVYTAEGPAGSSDTRTTALVLFTLYSLRQEASGR